MMRAFAAAVPLLAALLLAACQTPPRRTPAPAEGPATVAAPAPSSKPAKRKPRQPATVADDAPHATAAPAPPADTLTGDEVFTRLIARLETPACGGGASAEFWRKRYAGHPDRFAERLTAILPLLAYVTLEVERADLPGEFALIPIVESWYRPDALGAGGPAGMWQMVAGTARGNGIVIVPGYDGRLSPLQSTEAALAHLADLLERFGNWRLAAMAYNAGEQRVQRIVARDDSAASGDRRRPAGLAGTTYEYISKLKALSCLLAEPERHRLRLPGSAVVPRLEAIDVPPRVHRLDSVAASLDLPPGELRHFNAGHRHGIIAADAPRRILVPAATRPHWPSLADLVEAPPPAPKSPSQTTHTVVSGDSLWSIARRHGLKLDELMRWNGLTASSVLRPGQVLRLTPP
ncbi:transglycosylase SLT domain-containing protein [Rehaibacterium terrae]|jgi:membrane-bound lytic murein transglycosylase D|uniref:Membrane-bound lytic murein transglycosylase D n=1 Tax=Rehaibacterium terrae TaxID=1341696 RepID=A0A7W7XZQ1_9GAMM|nr:transglycosylase SLT domain-containing protein [Rehaibacterium terrae]MBB5015268.1 membrane-bound lytic murein transglycosylase D [Rehaibacterium terrae]